MSLIRNIYAESGMFFLGRCDAPLRCSLGGEMVDSEAVDVYSRLEGIDLSLSLRAPHCERLPLVNEE